jgi:hypothetical protein
MACLKARKMDDNERAAKKIAKRQSRYQQLPMEGSATSSNGGSVLAQLASVSSSEAAHHVYVTYLGPTRRHRPSTPKCLHATHVGRKGGPGQPVLGFGMRRVKLVGYRASRQEELTRFYDKRGALFVTIDDE